jgi:hypothetical protein
LTSKQVFFQEFYVRVYFRFYKVLKIKVFILTIVWLILYFQAPYSVIKICDQRFDLLGGLGSFLQFNPGKESTYGN